MKLSKTVKKLNEQYGDIIHKADELVRSDNYCKGLTKQQLLDYGIVGVVYLKELDEWQIHRYWYKNNSKVRINKIISITDATRHHKYRGDKSYPKVTFAYKSKIINITLAKMVYAWYKGDIPDGYVVDHIDNDSYNNLPNNLQLLTIEENLAKRFTDDPSSWTNQYGKQKGYKKNEI